MNHPLTEAAANSYSWWQNYMAIRWQLCPCSLPAPCLSGRDPLLLMGLSLCWEKNRHYSSKGLDTQGCGMGFKEQPGMCKWWKIINGKALGACDRGSRQGWEKEQTGNGSIWSCILSSPNDHKADDNAYQNALRKWWPHFILQLSGQPGQSSVCKPRNKVSAAALGLVFWVMSKQSKNKKQIARPEYDETEEWKSWLKHFPNATQRNRWRKKWNVSSLLLCTYCNTQH